VFAGGFSLEGAGAVGGHVLQTAEPTEEQMGTRAPSSPAGGRASQVVVTLGSLVDKSLLQSVAKHGGDLRFTMLETIREYADERLETLGGAHDAHRRYALYYLRLAEEAEPELIGQEQAVWLERLEQEHQNLRAALEWTLVGQGSELAGEVETGARIAGALVRFWDMHGHWSEGRRWLKAVLARNAVLRLPSTLSAQVLLGAGRLASFQDDRDEAQAYFTESLALYRQLGDKWGMTEALNGLALLATMRGDRVAARTLLEESLGLSRSMGDLRGAAKTLSNLAQLTIEMGDLEEAEAMQTEALGTFRELDDKWGMAVALENMGQLAAEQGSYERAIHLLQESLLLTEELGDKARLSWVMGDLGIVWLALRDYENAIDATGQALELFSEMGDKNGQSLANYILGVAKSYKEDLKGAESCFTRSLLICRQVEAAAGCAPAVDGLAAVALKQGDPVRAARLLGISSALRQGAGYRVEMVERPLYEHTANEVQRMLGSEVFSKACEDARNLPLAQAIAYALGGT
jgi:tetratricopeptide (TPR) repeat protein